MTAGLSSRCIASLPVPEKLVRFESLVERFSRPLANGLQLRAGIAYLVLLALCTCICTATSTFGRSEELLAEVGVDKHDPSSDLELGLAAGGLSRNGYVPPFYVYNMGGLALSRPCCARTYSDRIDCLVRGPRSSVWHWAKDDGYRYSWRNIGGFASSDIECLSPLTGKISLFVLGERKDFTFNTFAVRLWAEGTRGHWTSLGSSLPEVPTCISLTASNIDCVLRNARNEWYRISSTGGSWGDFVQLGKQNVMQPFGCGKSSSKRLDCLSVDSDGQLLRVSRDSGGWKIHHSTNVTLNGRLSVVRNSSGRIDIMGLGQKNDVLHMTWSGGKWSRAVSLGGVFDTDPHCLGLGGRLHCFAVGYDSRFYYNGWKTQSLWVGREWSGWSECDGRKYEYVGPPYCISTGDDEISCFVRDIWRNVVRFTFDLTEKSLVPPLPQGNET